MTISDTSENAIMALIFNGSAWAGYADNTATTPQTQIQLGLHTADPGDAGNMTTSEVTYTSYTRAAANRNSAGFTVSGTSPTQAALTAAVSFAAATGGSSAVTFFSTGKTGGGAAPILFSGTVAPTITVTNGVTPQLTTATVCTLD